MGIGCKPDAARACDELDLPMGLVVRCTAGKTWVFIGWRSNTVGPYPVFVRAQTGDRDRDGWGRDVQIYKASVTETLIRKFPVLAERRRS